MMAEGIIKYWPVMHGLATSMGPFIASQFNWSSARYFDYQSKKIFIKAYQDFVAAEIANLSDLRHVMRLKVFDAVSLEDRLIAEGKMRLVNEEINRLLVYKKVPEYIDVSDADESMGQPAEPVSEVWIDRFNNLARQQNEEWRTDLMAIAFAKENASPGSIGLDVIHVLGTLDQTSFYNFSALLEISFKIHELRCIPFSGESLMERKVKVEGRERSVGSVLFQLEHAGLFAGGVDLGLQLKEGDLCQLQYGNEVLDIQSKTDRFYGALITTRLGASLANLCVCETTNEGWEMFDHAEQRFKRDGVLLKRWII